MRLLLIVPVLSCLAISAQVNPARDLVNPFIGTGGHGHTFPGACVPNGLVQLSPDTRPDGYMDWDGCGGYHYSDSIIYGFSHTHLSGTGVADLCDVLIKPLAGSGGMHWDARTTASRFDHSSEVAQAGYYKVDLLPPPPSSADMSSVVAARPTRIDGLKITAELTATARVGMHRYTFPKGVDARIVLDLPHRDKLMDACLVKRVGDNEVVGERSSSSWAEHQRLFYCIRFSTPITDQDVEPSNIAGRYGGFHFGPQEQPLIVKVGISAVSIEGARKNLETEAPGWDFDAVRAQAEAAWNTKLNRIQVKGGTKEQQRTFYTALYHSYVAPYVFNDVDGNYRGMDGEVHHADHNVYTVFSLWDTFRALHPLMTVLEPEMTSDWIKTFLLHYQQGGRLPVWELWGNETDCMIGYHSVSVIADAYAKGIRDFDAELALQAMVASAEADHFGLKAYRDRGYISSEDAPESVSRTLEYAYDDWCIARFAELTGKSEVAHRFYQRSRNWQNLFDPGTRFFRARRNGGFIEPFDPFEVNFNFTEANAWQYSLFVPHDMAHFTSLLGGPEGLGRRLEALFNAGSSTTGRDQADITGLIGQYAHGNEPSHSFAYLSNLSDRPMMTDSRAQAIMTDFYHDAPDGLIGNEDCGQMSAWYVWSAMGLYPLCPGKPEYTVGMPLFDEVGIDIGGTRKFIIASTVAGGLRSHVSHVMLNGAVPGTFKMVPHAAIMEGGILDLELGPEPGGSSGGEPANDTLLSTPVPVIRAASQSFTDSLLITLSSSDELAALSYALDGAMSTVYERPFWIHATASIEAISCRAVPEVSGRNICSKATAHFTKVEGGRSIQLGSTYANEYAAGGDRALIDGLRGGTDYRTGEWQGTRAQDLVVTIDLGRVVKLERVGLSALQDQKSWIWLPKEVTIAVSTNQRQWSSRTITHDVDPRAEGTVLNEFWTEDLDRRARYITVVAKNAGPCPDWHVGKGGTTWIFADEVLIETD